MSGNKKKQKIILTGTILILINFLLIIGALLPKITIDLNGKSIINIDYGNTYNDEGAVAYLSNIFGKEQIEVKTSGHVNLEQVGKYIITYTAKASGKKKIKTRIVNVIDKEKPKITVNGNVKLCKSSKAFDANATAVDNYDGDITSKIKYRIENDKLYLMVKDSSNNMEEIESTFKYVDNEKPIITLNGSSVIYLNVGEKYEEYGATSFDSCDGDLTASIKITGEVNYNKIGVYVIKYESTDSLGNKTILERKVYVQDSSSGKVVNGNIYLTFDDGPGGYTKEYLNLLDKYNIKATFFVTGQFPKYFDLIKEEYEKGHTIGIHTYTHKWEIYSSVDTYLNDFNKIEQVVFEKTGKHVKYFRFPGGSSNTISRRYCDKIMTKLTNLMQDKGYVYFDWTFDSGDTVKGKNTKEEIIKTVKSYLKGNGDYIILMHDLKKSSLEALPEIIEYALSKGYKFKKIDESTPVKHFKVAN